MRRSYVLVGMLTLASPAGVAGAQQATRPAKSAALPDLATALKNIAAAYRAPEHEMWFTQTYLAKAYNQTSTSQGRLIVAGPDKAYWHYTTGSYAVINGPTAGFYEAPNRHYYLQPAAESPYAAATLAFTYGALAAQCNLTIYPGARLQYPNGYVLVCDPKTPPRAFTQVFYCVDAASSEVRRVLILDAQGNRNRFDLDQLQGRASGPLQLFSLTPPPGAVAVGAGGIAAAAPTSSGAMPLTPKPPGP